MSSGQPDGVGYAEQEEAVRALSRHYTAGRLDVDEFDERVRRARSSTTGAELGAVFADLPEPRPSAADRAVPPGTAADDATRATASGTTGAVPESGPGETGPGETGAAGAGGSSEETVATPRYPGAAAQDPDATRRYPTPGPQPTGPYPDSHQPGGQYPGAQYPDPHQPGGQYPGGQYPDARYPGGYDQYGAQYGIPPYGAVPYPGAYPPPGVPYGMPPGGWDPAAPYGWDPMTGRPYSDKQKIVAGLLVTFLTFGIGGIWGVIDGIVTLAGSPTDPQGRPLRP